MFFCRTPDHPLRGETHDYFTWIKPHQNSELLINRARGLHFHRVQRSTLLRRVQDWIMYRCYVTNVFYYYNPKTEETTFSAPECYNWRLQLKISKLILKMTIN